MEGKQMNSVYLDYNATTPIDTEVQQVILNTLQKAWQNPSSKYSSGIKSKIIIEEARHQVASMIGSHHTEIIFTSGGTESNNIVIYSALDHKEIDRNVFSNNLFRPHIIATNIEHDSIRLILEHLHNEEKIDVTFVAVSKSSGKICPKDIMNAVRPNTCLITVMLANNETGIIQPVAEIGEALKKLNKIRISEKLPPIYLHTDAAQAIGKINVDVQELGVDYLTFVGHKFYGPRIGALYVRGLRLGTVPLRPLFFGGTQELSYRPGTENTPMIAGIGKAAQLVEENLAKYKKHMMKMKIYLQDKLKDVFQEEVLFNNFSLGKEDILPNTISVSFPCTNLTGQEILKHAAHIEASTGAACHSGEKASSVLLASGISQQLAATTLRLSVGRETQREEIDFAITCLRKALS